MEKLVKKGQRYALRKLSIGVVSVAVATIVAGLAQTNVAAAEFAVDEERLVNELNGEETVAAAEEDTLTTVDSLAAEEETEDLEEAVDTSVRAGAEDERADAEADTPEEKKFAIGDEEVTATTKKPEVAPVELSNKPDRIAMAMTKDPAHSMNFSYFTKEQLEDAGVWVSEREDMQDAVFHQAHSYEVVSYFHEKTKDGHLIFNFEDPDTGQMYYYTDEGISSDNKAWTDGKQPGWVNYHRVLETTNHVTVKDLKPGTKYFYRVGSQKNNLQSRIGQFTTAKEGEAPFSFIHVTDSQNAWWNENVRDEAAFGANTLAEAQKVAQEKFGGAAFTLHTGDLIETGWEQNEDEYKSIFNLSQDTMLNNPFTFVAGNHDENTSAWFEGSLTHDYEFIDHTNAPITNNAVDGGSYYSYDYQGVHMVVLNTNDSDQASTDDTPTLAAIGEEQFAWLEKDLADARKRGVNYIMLAYHKPLYSASYHALQDADVRAARDRLAKLTDKYKVDVVLSGHDHTLAITKPLQYDEDSFVNAKVADYKIVGEDKDGEPIIKSDGSFYLNPNTIGAKAYADIYNWSLEKLWKVEKKLAPDGKYPLTQAQLDEYRDLFLKMDQPNHSDKFEKSHSNYRDASIQNFYILNVTKEGIKVNLYQTSGDLAKGEERVTKRLMGFTIANRNTAVSEETPGTDKPETEKPEGEKPETEKPEGEKPETENPKAKNPKQKNQRAKNPKPRNPKAKNLKRRNLKAKNLKRRSQKGKNLKRKNPKPRSQKGKNPKRRNPTPKNPKVKNPKQKNPKATRNLLSAMSYCHLPNGGHNWAALLRQSKSQVKNQLPKKSSLKKKPKPYPKPVPPLASWPWVF